MYLVSSCVPCQTKGTRINNLGPLTCILRAYFVHTLCILRAYFAAPQPSYDYVARVSAFARSSTSLILFCVYFVTPFKTLPSPDSSRVFRNPVSLSKRLRSQQQPAISDLESKCFQSSETPGGNCFVNRDTSTLGPPSSSLQGLQLACYSPNILNRVHRISLFEGLFVAKSGRPRLRLLAKGGRSGAGTTSQAFG